MLCPRKATYVLLFFWQTSQHFIAERQIKTHKWSLFFPSSLWQSTLQSCLCFASLMQRNKNSILQLSDCFWNIQLFWMSDGFEFVSVCTRVSTDLTLYFQGSLSGCKSFIQIHFKRLLLQTPK